MREKRRHLRIFSAAAAGLALASCSQPEKPKSISSTSITEVDPPTFPPTPINLKRTNKALERCPIPKGVSGGRLYVERSCTPLDDFLADDALQSASAYQNLKMIDSVPPFGRDVIRIAMSETVKLCDAQLAESVSGRYAPSSNKISIDFSDTEHTAIDLATMAHELWHAVQDKHDTKNFYTDATLYENQKIILSQEAAAEAFEVMIVFLAEQNGMEGAIENYTQYAGNKILMEAFTEAYNVAVAENTSNEEALMRAANATFKVKFNSQSFLNHYNNNLIRFTFGNHRLLKDHKGTDFKADVDKDGYISQALRFSSYADVPANEELFGDNAEMVEIFEVVELFRQEKVYGKNSPGVKAFRSRLEMQGNRFVNVDFDIVDCAIKQGTLAEDAFRQQIEQSDPTLIAEENLSEVTSQSNSAHRRLRARPN